MSEIVIILHCEVPPSMEGRKVIICAGEPFPIIDPFQDVVQDFQIVDDPKLKTYGPQKKRKGKIRKW